MFTLEEIKKIFRFSIIITVISMFLNYAINGSKITLEDIFFVILCLYISSELK